MKKHLKKILIIAGSVIIIAAITLTVLFELYIYHYNRGNEFYETKLYEKAITEYKKALKCHVAHRKECDIRVNVALAMVAPLDLNNLDKLTDEEKQEYIAVLEDAIDILVEEDCAHRDDENGHDADAQKLKDELQAILDELKKEPDDEESSGGQSDQDDPANQQQPDDEPIDPQQQQLQEIMQQGTNEHNTDVDEYGDMMDYSYYNGDCW